MPESKLFRNSPRVLGEYQQTRVFWIAEQLSGLTYDDIPAGKLAMALTSTDYSRVVTA
jgi:hypothetical protein